MLAADQRIGRRIIKRFRLRIEAQLLARAPGEGLGVTVAMASALLGIVMGGIGANMALKK